jgi:hypothetical protein
MEESIWYARFGDIPALNYTAPAGVRRPDMPKRFLNPERHTYDWNGAKHVSLSWPDEEGNTSASPAMRWPPDSDPQNPPPSLILQRLYETLELPGIASDYHFALLRAYDALASHARQQPELLEDVERLCLLDIALLETLPEIVGELDNPEQPPIRVPAFDRLVTLYERNGLLDDAIAIARRGAALGQGEDDVERIAERLAAVQAEDA